jgi:hypothetical protein
LQEIRTSTHGCPNLPQSTAKSRFARLLRNSAGRKLIGRRQQFEALLTTDQKYQAVR